MYLSYIIITSAGEFLALSGERLNGKELVAVGMAIHFVPSAVSFFFFLMLFLS